MRRSPLTSINLHGLSLQSQIIKNIFLLPLLLCRKWGCLLSGFDLILYHESAPQKVFGGSAMILLIFLRYKRLYQQLIQPWEKPIQGKAACTEINAAYGPARTSQYLPDFLKVAPA
jgi:hypothetical protein